MSFFVFTSYLNGLSSLIFGIFVLLKHPKGTVNRVFALLAGMIALWAIGIANEVSAPNDAYALLWLRIFHVAVCLIPIAFFHFSMAVINAVKSNIRIIATGYLMATAFIVLIPFEFFIRGVQQVINFPYYLNPGPLYHVFMIYFVALPALAEWELVQFYRRSKGDKGKQAIYVFIAGLIGFLGGLTSYLPAYNINVYPAMNGFVFLYVLILTISVVRHRLMDIDVVIKKTLIFAGLFTAIMIPILTAMLVSQSFLGAQLKLNPWVTAAIAVFFVILIYDPIRELMMRLTDRFLFQKRVNYQYLLRLATKGLSKINTQKHQLDLIARFLVMQFRIKSVAIYMHENGSKEFELKSCRSHKICPEYPQTLSYDSEIVNYLRTERAKPYLEYFEIESLSKRYESKERIYRYDFNHLLTQMKKLNAHLILSSFYRDDLQGILILGEKRSEEAYKDEEILLFRTLAQETALSIENARVHDALIDKSNKLEEANEELRKAQEQVINVKQEAAVAGVSGGISHEVKNYILPLSAGHEQTRMSLEDAMREIKGWCEHDAPLTQKDKERLLRYFMDAVEGVIQADICAEGIDNVARTLNQMAKGEAAEMTRVSLKTFLTWMVKGGELRTYGDRIKSQALEEPVEVKFGPQVPAVHAHAGLLRAVFLNLFKNAIYAIKDIRHPHIEIYAEKDPDNEKMVRIKFSDNGCGIPPEVVGKIFDYEFTTKGKSGEGKGLYTVKNIIEEHKGTIEVTSEIGKGTTFIIRLCKWEDPL